MKENELKKVLEIAIPSTVAWIGHIGYNVVDNLMVGKILGTSALAACGIAAAIYFIFLIFGAGSTGIMTALISEKVAIKEKNGIVFVFQNSLIFTIILGAIISFTLYFSCEYIVDIVNKQKELEMDIKAILKMLSFCPFFVCIFFAFERLTEGVNRTKIAMYTVFICNILNGVFNYIFLTHFNSGVVGVAKVTFVTNIFEVLIIVLLVKRDAVAKVALQFKYSYNSLKEILHIAKLGLPGGVFGFVEASCFGIAGFIAGFVSVNDVAAHQIILWSINFILTPVFGFSMAITARIAYNVALNKNDLAFKMGLISIITAGIYMFVCMIIFYIFKNNILSFMLKESVEDLITLNLIVATLFIVIFVEVFDGVQVITGAVLRGYKDTQIPVILALISYFLICIPCAYYLGYVKNLGVYGVWTGIGIGLFIQAILTVLRFLIKHSPKN